MCLLCIAFFTILERKILRFTQNRKGPNLVGPLGILQPFSDGLKLLTKNSLFPYNSKIVFMAPVLFFFSSMLIWGLIYTECSISSLNSLLVLLCLRRVGALIVFFSGWGGQSTFSFMGGIRASAQIISYEVAFSFILICPFSISFSLSFRTLKENNLFLQIIFRFFFVPVLLTMILAETNRAPFDLTEGESELVRGFNTEFSSVSFTFLFLSEYSFILFFSFICSVIFRGSCSFWFVFLFSIIWIRSCFPRKRYDELINLMWMIFLPLSIFILTLFITFGWIF